MQISETPAIVQERYELSQELKRIERRLADIDSVLKRRTGERQIGSYLVNVTSSNRTHLDTDAVKQILGEATPYKVIPTVRLTVVPA